MLVLASTGGLLVGCGAIATAPDWAGGGLKVTGPRRAALQEATDKRHLARLAAEPDQVGALHVLVMHGDSKAKPDDVERSRDAARARAQECLVKLRAGADFAVMVREYSDEPGAGERGGDLGVFRRDVMVKAFSDAAFALKVGEISEVVETPYGFHVIKRTK